MEEGVVRLEPLIGRIESSVTSLNEKMDRLDSRVGKIDENVDRLDARNDERFERLDGRIVELDRKLAVVETNMVDVKENTGRLDGDMRGMRQSIDLIHDRLGGTMRFMIGVLISFFTTLIGFGAAILGVIAKALHWLP